ncbi:hypothetical protein P4133_21490 [Pseudomonas aeruginosa]|nr:hypothetical protein [Pseudomonas aeruginosa]
MDGDNYDSRYIERHAGPDLYILGGTEGIPAGSQPRVYPLRRARGNLRQQFGNILNFRGFNKL